MSPPQAKWFYDTSRKRCMVKANKVGGTFEIGAEAWMLDQGTHPHYKTDRSRPGLVLVPDLSSSYADDMCAVLRESQPPGILADNCKYSQESGYTVGTRARVSTRDGGGIIFRSSHQDPKALEGIRPAWIIINEPPSRHLWGAIMRCASYDDTIPVMMVFTLVDDVRKQTSDYKWLQEIVQSEASGWSEHTIPLVIPGKPLNYQVPFRSERSVQQQMDECPPWEYDQRILAKWSAAAIDRLLQKFSREEHVVGPDCIPKNAPVRYELWMDHGERPGKEVVLLAAIWSEEGVSYVYILDEYDSKGRTIIEVDVLRVSEMLAKHGMTYYDISKAVGDINTAGKRSAITVNAEFEREVALLLRSGICPFEVAKAIKGPGSVMRGARIINTAMATGRLGFSPDCELLIQCIEQWRGGSSGPDADLKDPIDALRYGGERHLDATRDDETVVRIR